MRPSLVKINPQTNQPYTASELAQFDLNKRVNNLANAGFGEFQSVQSGSIREAIPDATNDFFSYSQSGFIVGNNNEETRAQLQPWYEQLGNSIGKMGTTAGATFLDGVVGTIAGLANMAIGDKDQDLYNRFINNPISQNVVEFQEKMEQILPNYRTQEEQEKAWYENAIFNPANFWGETIIKNMGFAIGAIGAGVVTGGIGESVLGITTLKKSSNILKGLTNKIQQGATLTESEASLLKTLSSTDLASVKGQQVIKELDEWAKKIQSRTFLNQALSSFTGAAAEARIEALQGSKEFARQYQEDLATDLQLGKITPEEYELKMQNLDKELSNYQNSVFTGNLALLSISNFNQFKNVFSKGFTPNKLVKDAVEGDIVEGYAVKELSKARKISQLIKNPLWEMTEEQGQFAIQKGMDSYYSLKSDAEANATVKNAIFSIGQGLKEAYGSAEGWENAFAGLVIGGLGVPIIAKKESGKYGLRLAGGIAEEYKQQKESQAKLSTAVTTANNLINDGMLSKLYNSATIDAALQKRFNQTLTEEDRMNGKLIASQQLTNIVDAMTDIGKFDDFIQLLDEETKLSATELRDKYKHKKQSLTQAKELEDVDFFMNMSDDQVEKYVKDKADTAKTRANSLKNIKDNIAVRFGDYNDDAKKEMLFLAAGALEVDDRIPKVAEFLKQKFVERAGKFLNDPRLKMTENIQLFTALATPEEFEEFLLQENGLEKYSEIIQAYLRLESDPKVAIEFAEKAKDLFALVAKRQRFNDEYFKMATDENYVSNKEAYLKSLADSERARLRATSEFKKSLYDNHTNEDPEFGFESDEFRVKLDEEEVTDVTYETKDGTKEVYKNVKPVLDEEGKPVERTDKNGNKYRDYTGIDNTGKEVVLKNLKNPVESTRKETPEVVLSFKKGDPNVLVDQDGNEYSLDDLAQDPAFLDPNTTTIVTRAEIRQEIIDQTRRQSLAKMMQVNQVLINNIESELNELNQSIEFTQKLLERAKANKTGKTSTKIDGKVTVFTVFALENLLANHNQRRAELESTFNEAQEEAARLKMQAAQAKLNGFQRDSFDKDLEAVGKQLANAQNLLQQYEAQGKKLSKVITSLKNLLKVVYPKFKKLYMELYGVDPSTVEDIIKRWQTDVTPLLRKLRTEEINRYENITVKEQELQELQKDIEDLKRFVEESKNLLDKINLDKAYFEAELKSVLLARTAAKASAQAKAPNSNTQKADAKLDVELGESQSREIEEFKSAKRSVKKTGITAGKDYIDDATVNSRPASQRWYRTASKVNLNNGSFSLRIVSVNERPDLFEDVPEDLKKDALACILYNKDNPVDTNLQPIDPNSPEEKLVYTFIEKPATSQAQLAERFYDANEDPFFAESQQQALDAMRKAMQEKLASGKPVFVPIDSKSSGILQTTGARRTPGNDGTVAIWSALLGNGTDAEKTEAYNQGSIQVGVPANQEDAINGIAYITAGGKEVKVRSGLAYFVTKDAEVIPLLSRKLTTSEVDLILDLLETKSRGIHELATSEEDAEALKKETAVTPKSKKEARKKAAKGGKKEGVTKQRKFIPTKYYNPKTKRRGYYKWVTVKKTTKKQEAKKETPLAAVEKINILKYISDLIYFGPQTKPDGSLIASNPNKQTEIFLSNKDAQTGLYTTLTFWNFEKGEKVTIPFTPESLAENREALATFLANKYHQVRKSKLTGTNKRGKDFKHTEVKNVVVDEQGNPLYVETQSHSNYESYLLNDKKGERSVNEIPLTTNAAPDAKTGNVLIKSVYFTFPLSPGQITEAPPRPRASKTAPKATAPAKKTNTRVDKAKDLLSEILKYINNADNFKPEKDAKLKSYSILEALLTKFEKADKDLYSAFEKFKTDNIELFQDNEVVQTLTALENAEALKEDEVAVKDLYEEALFIQKALEDFIEESKEEEGVPVIVATTGEEGSGIEITEEEAEANPLKGFETKTFTEEEDDSDEYDSEEGYSGTDETKEDDGKTPPFRTQNTGGPRINIEEAKANVKRMLPNLPVKVADKIANGIAQGAIDINGVMHLSNFAEEGTEYHEALHGLMLGILTDEELADVYKEAKKLYGEPSEEELAHWKTIYPKASKQVLRRIFYDEKLAEDFRTYALTDGKIFPSPKIKGIFERVLDFIKALFGKTPTKEALVDSNPIYSMFKNLYNGAYSNREYDVLKVKSRIGTNALFRPLQVPNTNPVNQGVLTKEIVNAVIHKMFKLVRSSSSTVEDFSQALEGEGLNIIIDQSINAVINDIKGLKASDVKERATKILLPLLTRDEKIGLKSKKSGQFFRDTEVYRVIREYIENDLGIKTGLYKEEEELDEVDVNHADAAFRKDPTTISPREGVNSFIKLMLSGIQDYERDAEGNFEDIQGNPNRKVGDYGLPMLVNPNLLYNHLLQLLSKATSYTEMLDILKANVRNLEKGILKFPYLQDVIDFLEDPHRLQKSPSSAFMLKLNFQQAMNKAVVDYKFWLVNEEDVKEVDPTSDNLHVRIIDQWRNNIINSLNTKGSPIVKKGERLIFNPAAVKAIQTDAARKYDSQSFDYYVEILDNLGFSITAPGEFNSNERDIVLQNAKFLISSLANNDVNFVFNPSAKNSPTGRINALALLEAVRNIEKTDFQHLGPDGKTRYGIIQHNMISTISQVINNMPAGTNRTVLFNAFPFLDSVYSANSHLLNNILFKYDLVSKTYKRTSTPYKITLLEGGRLNSPGAEGQSNTDMVKADRAWVSFNSILKGTVPVLRTSDKSNEFGLNTGSPFFTIESIDASVKEYVDIFMGYLKDELESSLNRDADAIKYYRKNIDDSYGGVYFFEDILKNNNIRPILVGQETVNQYIKSNENKIVKAILNFLTQHDQAVMNYLKDSKIVEIKTNVKGENSYRFNAVDIGILESFGKKKNILSADEYKALVRTFSLNSLIGNIEQTKMFFGHPAFYKSVVDLYKRTAGGVGTKIPALVDDHVNAYLEGLDLHPKDGKAIKDGTFQALVLEEPITDSTSHAVIQERFEAEGFANAKELASKYLGFEEADGQGYITLPEYREFMIRLGQLWSPSMETTYKKVMNGEDVSLKDLKVFNPLKAQYFALTKIENISVPVYLKFSLLPLIPTIYKGTKLEAIAESMMAKGQGVAVYPSGIKTGALMQDTNGNFIEVYNENGEGMPIPKGVNTLPLNYKFMGLQVNTGFSIKQETTRGSQQAKLVLANLFSNGQAKPITIYEEEGTETTPVKLSSEDTQDLVKKYHKTINKITAYKAAKLLEEIGAVDNKDGTFTIVSYEKLAKILQTAARNRNASDNLLEALTTIKDKSGKVRFKYLMDSVPGRNKIENILFAVVKNDLIMQKYFGGSRIQAAGTLFERSDRKFSPESGNLLSNPDLKFYRKGKYGETLPAQVKLAPNNEQIRMINSIGGQKDAKGNYLFDQNLAIVNNLLTKYLSNDESRYMKEAALAEGLDLEALRFVAYRIPTQGVNTIEHMEIIEFLHPAGGEAIMLPSEIVVKSGGDYDIDKLNVYFKYIDRDTNRVIQDATGIKGMHNELVKLNQMFLSAPEHFTELTIPNDPSTLKALAKQMEGYYPPTKVTKTTSLTWLYNLEVAENYLVGKAAVGIVARHITHHTLSQQANLTLNRNFKGKTGIMSTRLYFQGLEDKYDMSSEYDAKKDKKINHIISEFLSAFVDIGKDPFIVSLNGSTKTADMYMYLLRRGVPIGTVTSFMNQPVIKEYFKKVFNNQAIFKERKKGVDNKKMVLTAGQIRKELEAILNEAYKKVSNNPNADITKIEEDLFTERQLKTNLGKSLQAANDLDFIRDQANVLKNFFGYMEQADQLRILMDATSQDTRTHKNFNSLDNTKALSYKVIEGDMFTKDSRERLIKGTLLEGFEKAQKVPNVFRQLFVTESEAVKAELDKLRSYLFLNGVNMEDTNTIMDRYKNDFIVYAVSAYLKAFPGNAKTILDLFKGDNSLAKRIAKYQKNPSKTVRNNPFLKALLPLLERPNAKVEGMKMTSTQKTTFDINQIVNGFTAVYSSKNEQTAETAKLELALFAFLQSGLDNSPVTWYDKVPVDIAASIINPAISSFLAKDNQAEFVQKFTHQFFRNSAGMSSLIPWVGKYSADALESDVKLSSSGILTLSEYDERRYKERLYLKISAILPKYKGDVKAREEAQAAGLPTVESLLLVKVSDGKYQLASKLGDGIYMKEYNPELRQSYLPENNIDTGEFAKQFPTWSEPIAPPLPTDNGYSAYQNACS